jgi:hypothetical protein
MRVVRFTSPGVAGGLPILNPLSLAADRYVALMHGRELHLYDLRSSEAPVARIPHVVGHALAPSCLIVADTRGGLTRWELREGRWAPTTSFSFPADADAASNILSELLLSRSGRYLLVESGPISHEASMGPNRGHICLTL